MSYAVYPEATKGGNHHSINQLHCLVSVQGIKAVYNIIANSKKNTESQKDHNKSIFGLKSSKDLHNMVTVAWNLLWDFSIGHVLVWPYCETNHFFESNALDINWTIDSTAELLQLFQKYVMRTR